MLWKESGPTSQTLVFMAQLATNQLCHSGHLIFQGAGTRQEQQDLVRRKGERETSLVPGTCFPMTQTSRRQEPLVIKKKKKTKKTTIYLSGVSGLSRGAWAQLPPGMQHLSSPTRDQTCILYIGRCILNHRTTRESSKALIILLSIILLGLDYTVS